MWPKILLGLALTGAVVGVLLSTKTLFSVNKSFADAKEAARPANVKIVKITVPSCTDCFNIDAAVDTFKKQNVKVEEEKGLSFDSPEASASVRKLGIKKLPAYLVTGEINKSNIESFIKSNGEVKNNTFVFTKLTPLFVDADTLEEVGKVTATILTDSSCPLCIDPKPTIEGFKKTGIKIILINEVSWNSTEGQKLINLYKITKIPTFVLSPEIDFYDSIKSNWEKIGTVESDKFYVARNLSLPYRDLEKNQILGLVNLVYLTDLSCSDCYKADVVQKPILKRGYGVAVNSERTVDALSAEGRALISKYNITKIPTILLSPEADAYTNLKNIWKNVGTVEVDGWYVFREMKQLSGETYKDLTTGEIVRKVKPTPAPAQ